MPPDQIDRFVDRDLLSEIIRSALGSAEVLEEVASRSHQHWTGFRKIVLVRCERRHQVRVHRWDEASPPAEEVSCHNHRWDFVSYVVSGKIANVSYSITSEEDGPLRHFKADAVKAGQNRGVRSLGGVSVVLESEAVVSAGQSYLQLADVLHSTVALQPTVTLLLQDSSRGRTSSVVQGGELKEFVPPAISTDTLVEDLEFCLSRLRRDS
ncbi:hypothetical protein [Glycomyces salinus]|uniref:hypothetical protein n=1 Tax=Glycomyces salinus TaxID=980294 RepID=UPI0018ECF8BF|nr:hypothetical protein [Glycomyces salinus]